MDESRDGELLFLWVPKFSPFLPSRDTQDKGAKRPVLINQWQQGCFVHERRDSSSGKERLSSTGS